MKKISMFILLIFLWQLLRSQPGYDQYPVYNGSDLGLTYSANASQFRIWSPVATSARLLLYKNGNEGDAFKTIELEKSARGTWFTRQEGNLAGLFYAFRVKINGNWSNEVTDPYAKIVGVNGKRAMVADIASTNPPGWKDDQATSFSIHNNPVDAVIYELHVRDAGMNKNSGIQHKGKFIGLAEEGTKSTDGLATGLDHLKEIGVTHIHLLPFYDYNSVDETDTVSRQYNWGYDPLNYNTPEGSYSTNPYDGSVRIKELKQMVQAFHKNGLRIVMDVVYNHTGKTQESNFNQLVPGYYYRHKKDGTFSDATACGNETASERPMMRKFMLESVLYWAKEYHIDGFRFDLMGVHDIETMNLISDELHKIRPDIILYGEGWTAGQSPLPDSLRALKQNAYKLHNIAVFSDDIRDGIKGSVFDIKDRGFATGKEGMEESVKFGIVSSGDHPQVDYTKVNYSKKPYTSAPWNVISYCECHDNNTLWDKINLSCPDVPEADRKKMHQLALTIVLTSQGIPFLHAGTEFMRTKQGVENSYNSGDSINAIDWSLKKENHELNLYVQQLIKLRKDHPAFRMTNAQQVKKYIRFDETVPPGVIMYVIDAAAVGDPSKKILVAFNGSNTQKELTIPAGQWKNAIGNDQINQQHSGHLQLEKYSSIILLQD